MAKRKPKPDPQDTLPAAGSPLPDAATPTDDPTSFDPATFDRPTGEETVPLLPVTAATEAAPRPAMTGGDADGRVTDTVPADATPEPRSAPTPDGDGATFKPLPNPFGLRADHEVGVGLLEDRRFKQMQIRFDQKPSDEVRQAMREAGYQWRSADQAWTKQIDSQAAWRTRAAAVQLFDRVVGLIREERGLGPATGGPQPG